MLVGVDARALASRRGVGPLHAPDGRGACGAGRRRCAGACPGHQPVGALRGVELRRTRLPSRMLHMTGAIAGRPRVDALLGDVDVTWLPAPAPVAVGDPYVLTVHDLSWEDRPGDFTAYERFWHRVARPAVLARGARAVVCDAPAVAEQLTERWGVEARVVEPGVDHADGVAPRPGTYLLYVGALEPRKGLDVLANAWARAQLDGVELLVAGEGREKVAGATHLGHVTDAELQELYAGAQAVVLPSRLEGFGLPPREAAALRHAVDRQRPPDAPAARHAARPPGDAGALAGALCRLPAERARLVAELPAAAHWDAAARELREMLEERRRRNRERSASASSASCTTPRTDLRRLLARWGPCARPQLVVVDAGSQDDGPGIARDWGAEVIEAGDVGSARPTTSGWSGSPFGTLLLNPDIAGPRPEGHRAARAPRPARGRPARPAAAQPRRLGQRSAHPLPGRAAALLPALCTRARCRARCASTPTRGAPGRRAARRLGDRRGARRHGPPRCARSGPFDADAVPVLRGPRPLPARPRRRRADDPPSRARAEHRGGHSTEPGLRRRAARAAGGAPPRGHPRHLGRRALALDDAAQALTFATRAAARTALRRDAARERAQLRALRTARRG